MTRPGAACWSCVHFSFKGGAGSKQPLMSCAQGVWKFEFRGATHDALERTLRTAENCTVFAAERVYRVGWWECLGCKTAFALGGNRDALCLALRGNRPCTSKGQRKMEQAIVSWSTVEGSYRIRLTFRSGGFTILRFAEDSEFQRMKEQLAWMPRAYAAPSADDETWKKKVARSVMKALSEPPHER